MLHQPKTLLSPGDDWPVVAAPDQQPVSSVRAVAPHSTLLADSLMLASPFLPLLMVALAWAIHRFVCRPLASRSDSRGGHSRDTSGGCA